MSEQPQPPTEAAFFTSIREWGIVRGTSGVLGGVVEGVGNRIGLARVPARLLTVVAWILLPGIVMLAYAAGWALLPDSRGNIILQNFGRGITNVGALIGIALLTLVGFATLDSGPIFSMLRGTRNFYGWDSLPFGMLAVLIPVFFFLAIITGVVVLIVWLVRRSNRTTADARVTSASHGTSTAGESSGTSSQGAAEQATAPHGPASQPSNASPQPWEPALLPGDPRTGVPASTSTVKAAGSAAHSADTAPTATGLAGPASASAAAPPPRPAPPAPPARPPAPAIPGPGRAAYLAFVAVLLISAAIAIGLAWTDQLAVSPVLAWGASITVGLGAILVLVALAGRKLGFLGFLSAFAVLLALLFAANADAFRNGYASSENWFGIEEEVVVDEWVDDEPDVTYGFDLTADLAADYSTVFLAGACVSPSEVASWSDATHFGESMATMRLDTVDEDLDIDLPATHTRLAIPRGTSLEIVGSGHIAVVWEGRDASCTTWADRHTEWERDEYGERTQPPSQTIFTATNPAAPVITIDAGADKTIYLEEVAP